MIIFEKHDDFAQQVQQLVANAKENGTPLENLLYNIAINYWTD
jgi:hypothetical protein